MWFSLVPVPATHVAHRMHAVRSAEAGFKARATTDTSCGSHLGSVAPAHLRGALAMHRRALAMGRGALAVNRLSVLRMHRCLARAARAAHHSAKVQAVVVRNLPPAFMALELAYDRVEALPRGVSQQVRFLQSTPAEPGRRSLGLQRRDGNSGFRRNSIHVRSARSNSAKHQNESRYDYT